LSRSHALADRTVVESCFLWCVCSQFRGAEPGHRRVHAVLCRALCGQRRHAQLHQLPAGCAFPTLTCLVSGVPAVSFLTASRDFALSASALLAPSIHSHGLSLSRYRAFTRGSCAFAMALLFLLIRFRHCRGEQATTRSRRSCSARPRASHARPASLLTQRRHRY
jgi:hypothetical protein